MDADYIWNKIGAAKARIEERENRLKRLRPVKTVVAGKKAEFRTVKSDDKKVIDQKYTWKGETYDKFKSKGADLLDEDERFYSAGLDVVLDAINDEITRLENENAREVIIIGDLYAALNSLANEVENAFN